MHKFENNTRYRVPDRNAFRGVTVAFRTKCYVYFNDGSRARIFEGLFDGEPTECFKFSGKRICAAWPY